MRSIFSALLLTALMQLAVINESVGGVSIGLPFSRFYSYDEIVDVSPGVNLGFDAVGRLTVAQNGVYYVLNDRSWIRLNDTGNNTDDLMNATMVTRDFGIYGTTGSWGTLVLSGNGMFKTRSLRPDNQPLWTQSNDFLILKPTEEGAIFGNFAGCIYWNKKTGQQTFFEVEGLADILVLEGNLYTTSIYTGISKIDLKNRRLIPLELEASFVPHVIEYTRLSKERLLILDKDDGLFTFDGKSVKPWKSDLDNLVDHSVTSLCQLPEGNIAIAIENVGLYILTPEGNISAAYTGSDFRQIQNVVSNESGVLWYSTSLGIYRVHYGGSASVIDKRTGVAVNWPQVVKWKDRVVIASDGCIYDSYQNEVDFSRQFKPVENQPNLSFWGIGSDGDTLLAGNFFGVYLRTGESSFEQILPDFNVNRLVMVSPTFCYVIGTEEITAIQKISGEWQETVRRIPGLGYPSIVHAAGNSAWVELGTNRAARISHENGQIKTQLFDEFPWSKPTWTFIGVFGDFVIMSGEDQGRVFFNESSGEFCEMPADLNFLEDKNLPWLGRIKADSDGNVWGSGDQGIMKITRENGKYIPEDSRFSFIHDRNTNIHILEDDQVWVNAGASLYRLEKQPGTPLKVKPVVVSVENAKSGNIIPFDSQISEPLLLGFSQNSLRFRVFAGTYFLRSPVYSIHLKGPDADWSVVNEMESQFTLPSLNEGDYTLTFQLIDNVRKIGEPVTVPFIISPPWFRSIQAYFSYSILIIICIYIISVWATYRTRRQNRLLSRLVEERTCELQSTMEKLNRETQAAAILAERDRLASEIHDSVQQSLTGLILHIEATIKEPDLTANLKKHLDTARKMLFFTRKEVQHAVKDIESPLLENDTLDDALRRITSSLESSLITIKLKVSGIPQSLSSDTMHHMLRIAQEAITNAIRNGKSDSVILELKYDVDTVALTISDNGCGFDPEKTMEEGGQFGLRGMRNRARQINGQLTIDSKPQAGTKLTIAVPYMDSVNSSSA